MTWRIVAVVTVLLAGGTSARAVTEDDFQLRTGADLVALCSVPADDPLRVSAIHMCHGFCVGVYQTILAFTMHDKVDPLVCPPDPPPKRAEAIERFVVWAKGHPEHQGEHPVDFVTRHLMETYPCPKKGDEPSRGSKRRRPR